mmetsp:Transcript_36109/g.53830  ORF Transcript_36109/g.53830 Transcript_36109/m.53830 type:complete len:211 (+) Transcript_36109:254-886(+)
MAMTIFSRCLHLKVFLLLLTVLQDVGARRNPSPGQLHRHQLHHPVLLHDESRSRPVLFPPILFPPNLRGGEAMDDLLLGHLLPDHLLPDHLLQDHLPQDHKARAHCLRPSATFHPFQHELHLPNRTSRARVTCPMSPARPRSSKRAAPESVASSLACFSDLNRYQKRTCPRNRGHGVERRHKVTFNLLATWKRGIADLFQYSVALVCLQS